MTPDRWREIERLYADALQRDAEDRATFLDEACGGDHDLRDEVESLLKYGTRAEEFLETPASVADAPLAALSSTVRRLNEPSVPGRFVGRTLGSYDVQALIAAGGMGEVYRGVDTRLGRIVAIKVLPEHLATSPERRERFSREARIVSSLSHPHVCALYDIGVQDDIPYLILEHVDGETLEARLERGPASWPQALEYLSQIADALDKAHRRGIIHRDLKPANVMLTKSGAKVLDFGLAAWCTPPDGTAFPDAVLGSPARLTAEGRIMGTVHYVSPEQLRGERSDARTDIFAFGVLAYEMLTGKRAFDAGSHAELISAILKDDPRPIAEQAPDVPPAIVRTITRCLSKDPDERWQTANDLSFQLRSMSSEPSAADVTELRHRLLRRPERLLWTAAVLISLVLLASVWMRRPGGPGTDRPGDTPPVRFSVFPPEGQSFAFGVDTPFALSPDGRLLAYVTATFDGARQLWLHSLDLEQQHPVPGSEGASSPFWSPDSQWVGFFAANTLKKVRVSSGLTQIIARDVSTMGGASWNKDDTIIFPAQIGGLSRVSAAGGAVLPATKGKGTHFWPQFLGDGRHFIYAAGVTGTLEIGSLDNEPPRTLMAFPIRISALGYAPGYVFFIQDNTLLAQPFDEQRRDFSGEPMRLADGIPVTGPGRAPFSISAKGTLAYWTFPYGTPALIRWFDRDGRPSPAVDTPALYQGFSLSPSGNQLVFSRTDQTGGADLWLRDLTRNRESQLTFDRAAFNPHWSPDGSLVAFTGPGHSPPPKLFVKDVTSPGAATLVADTAFPNFASGWSGDGRSIVGVRIEPGNRVNQLDLWVHGLHDMAATRLSINTAADDFHGTVSPDNRWIAYVTSESGKSEVWVASFPSGEIRRRVSSSGGTMPQWTHGGREIVYLSFDKRVMAVTFHAGPAGVNIGSPQSLFRIDDLVDIDRASIGTVRTFVATADGQRFLAAVKTRNPGVPPIRVVVNWPRLLVR